MRHRSKWCVDTLRYTRKTKIKNLNILGALLKIARHEQSPSCSSTLVLAHLWPGKVVVGAGFASSWFARNYHSSDHRRTTLKTGFSDESLPTCTSEITRLPLPPLLFVVVSMANG